MTEIGAIGYIAACVAYIALIALLLTAWAGQKLATFLIAACVVSVFWCVIQATQYSPSDGISPALFTTDMLRCGSWYVFLTYLLSAAGRRRAAVIAANVVWLVCDDAFRLLDGKGHQPCGSITSVAIYELEVANGECSRKVSTRKKGDRPF